MFATRLRTLLESSNQNASDLARYCDVSPQAAHKWVTGESMPKQKRKEQIAAFFGMSTQELEYSQVLSLSPVARTAIFDAAPPSLKLCEQAAKLMIETELAKQPRSTEFAQGMRDRIIALLAHIEINPPFNQGTCQADAYDAGRIHGGAIISTKQTNPG